MALAGLAVAATLAAQSPAGGWQVTVTLPTQFSAAQIECADFYSTGGYRHVLREIGAENGLLVPQQTTGDVVYLNGAAGLSAGDEVRLMRLDTRTLGTDQFPGQGAYLGYMGRLFAMVGRARILQVSDRGVATARLELSCRASERGDFAIRWYPRVSPKLERTETINLLAPVEAPTQMLVVGREMASELGTGDEIFLGGRGARPQVGQRWLIFRRAASPSSAQFRRAAYGVNGLMGQPGVNLGQLASEPRPAQIVGEAVIIAKELGSSAAIVTYARDTILPGDEAMLER